jgi:hypothetical protein
MLFFFKKNSVYFYSFAIISPWREAIPSFEQTLIPSPKGDLCQVWLKLAQWFWRRSRKCKSLQTDRQTARQTDDGQKAIRIAEDCLSPRGDNSERVKIRIKTDRM